MKPAAPAAPACHGRNYDLAGGEKQCQQEIANKLALLLVLAKLLLPTAYPSPQRRKTSVSDRISPRELQRSFNTTQPPFAVHQYSLAEYSVVSCQYCFIRSAVKLLRPLDGVIELRLCTAELSVQQHVQPSGTWVHRRVNL